MSRAIAGLIATHLQLDPEDARGGAEAIWELLRQVEAALFEEDKMSQRIADKRGDDMVLGRNIQPELGETCYRFKEDPRNLHPDSEAK